MLTQAEADFLIDMKKKAAERKSYTFPNQGEHLEIPIVSLDGRERFLIDVHRGSIRLTKCTYQERYRSAIILVRLDLDGPGHQNPEAEQVPLECLEGYNGAEISCPHLHLYVEGYMDKWAIPVPEDKFPNLSDLYQTLFDFFAYCNVIQPPRISKGLYND